MSIKLFGTAKIGRLVSEGTCPSAINATRMAKATLSILPDTVLKEDFLQEF
jgi:hypothetical protein